MLRIKRSGIGFVMITFLFLNIGTAQAIYVQESLKANPVIDGSDKEAIATVKKDRNYSFRFTQVSLKQALEAIATEANLTLSYHSELLENSAIVNVSGTDADIDEALKKILNNTGLEYKITSSHHLVIFKKENIGHLKGKVLDDFTGDPSLQGAKVHLTRGNTSILSKAKLNHWRTTFVDPEGNYEINNLKPGVYRLFIVRNGTKEVYKKVRIRKRQTTVEVSRLKYISR